MATPVLWNIPDANPVIAPGQLHPGVDDAHAGAAHVLKLDTCFRIYYWGSGPLGHVILMAESPLDSPNDWRPVGGPLLEAVPESEHLHNGPSFPFVLPYKGDTWLMYVGCWGKADPARPLPNTTAVAVSDDAGLSWRYATDKPCISLDKTWDSTGTGSVSVVKAARGLRMYYTSLGPWFDKPPNVQSGHGDRIPLIGVGYAESDDGISWRKPLDGLMVKPREFGFEPYEYINSKPFVMRDGEGWRMWISTFGTAYRIRSLVSQDGLEWTRVPSDADGDLGVGNAGAFDDQQRCYASVVRDGSLLRMWFTGNGFGRTGIGYAEAYA
jgi:hypothetical protein